MVNYSIMSRVLAKEEEIYWIQYELVMSVCVCVCVYIYIYIYIYSLLIHAESNICLPL